MYIGALSGWLAGWYTGHIYVEHFEPVYLSDFSGLEEITWWEQIPRIFAGAGIFAGTIIGAAVVFCFSHKTSNNKRGAKGSNYLDQSVWEMKAASVVIPMEVLQKHCGRLKHIRNECESSEMGRVFSDFAIAHTCQSGSSCLTGTCQSS